jgi:P4 family phage/plasmid primase-like protien
MNVVLKNAILTEPLNNHNLYDTEEVEDVGPRVVPPKQKKQNIKISAQPVVIGGGAKSGAAMQPFSEYLRQHMTKKEENREVTNTRIGSKDLNIFGGSYHIPDAEYPAFMQMLHKYVIAPGAEEYLTEKQLDSEGPIAVDVDFRYSIDVEERQHSKEHVEDLIQLYLDCLKKMYQFDDETQFQVYVFEKDTVNRLVKEGKTKDGIHMIFGLKADHVVQQILRKRILGKIGEIWSDLPITNSWSDVFDDGISIGHTNWQLYGCRKPGNEPYRLKYVYDIGYDCDDGEMTMQEKHGYTVSAANIHKLSVRYREHPAFVFASAFADEYRAAKGADGGGGGGGGGAVSRNGSPVRQRIAAQPMAAAAAAPPNILNIRSKEELDAAVGHFLDGLTDSEYELREAYEYTMCLPESYYGSGSYNKWIRVGWALRNMNDRLFIVWAAFSAQAASFDFRGGIRDLYSKWVLFDMGNPEGLTKRSLMHWAKHENRELFEKIQTSSISYYIDQSIDRISIKSLTSKKIGGSTDYDLATMVYHQYKDEYVCASVKDNIWYRFQNHRWVKNDSGTTLRLAISTKIRDLYRGKAEEVFNKKAGMDPDSESYKKVEDRASHILGICEKLSQTKDKKNIMTEAKDLFYDPHFLENLDTNPYLMCFSNGVIDFKEKRFRAGYPWDNLSKCTNIPYRELKPTDGPVTEEIRDFMRKLFPVKELCEYMWDHLASTLLGTCVNQTFNMYIGEGQNGKSVLVELMTQMLGEYKGTVPTTLITQQRQKVGGLAPELVSMKGIRYAVMDEPRKGEVLNEGVMKQLTSGIEPIQCRAPYMINMLSFVPQFKLVVCSNVPFEIKSNDHGTWRRIRWVSFESLFTENPVAGDPDKPYQYKIDPTITERFPQWAEVFAAMLVERAYKTDGKVTDCQKVLDASKEYRNKQDYIAEFIKDKIVEDGSPNTRIKKTELNAEFKSWYQATIGYTSPSPREVHAYMDKKYGKYEKHDCWRGVRIKYDTDISMQADDQDFDEDIDEIGDVDV